MPNETAIAVDTEALFAARSLADPGVLPLALQAVRELGKDAPPFDRDRLDALLAVEERIQSLLQEDGADVLTRSAEGTLRDSDVSFAQIIQRLCAESAIGLQRFLRNREKWTRGPAHELLSAVTVRAIHSMHGYAKWGCFLGRQGRSIPWKQLHSLYFLAEGQGYAQMPVELHPGHPMYKPTPQALYIRALLLDLLQGSGLTPPQLEIADCWFGSWCVDYRLDTDYRARDHLFCVDLAGAHSLEVARWGVPRDSIRYFRAEGLSLQLDRARSDMRGGRLFSPLGSLTRLRPEDHLAVLAVLERFKPTFTAGLDNRVADRDPGSGKHPRIVAGAAPILAALCGDAGTAPDASGWRIYNRSLQSFGLVTDDGSATPLQPGSMVAMHDDEGRGWLVGTVVHRTQFGPRGALLAGVELVAEQPCAVGYERKGQNPTHALLAPGSDPTGRFDALLMRDTDYADGAQARVRVGEVDYRVRLGRPAAHGDGWVKARFYVEAKS